MATRNIAIQITLGGVDQTINSVNDLEKAIRQATNELKNFSGSPQDRERLVNQLKNANSQLREFKKNIQGVTVDQQIGKFLQLGSLITSTFATASTVLSSLGRDSEGFAEAQVKAQQILTLAFTASELARQKDTIQTLRNTAAQIAATFATKGFTGVLRLLFTTIKANPIGAFITLVTTAISLIVAFGSSSKKTTKELDGLTQAQNNYNQSVREGNIQGQIQFDGIIALNTAYLGAQISLNDYIEGLNTLVPNLQNINKETKEGRGLILDYATAQLGLSQIEAQVASERTILSEATKKQNQEQIFASNQRIQQLKFDAIEFRKEINRVEAINKRIGEDEQERQKQLKEVQEKRLQLLRDELNLLIEQEKRRVEILGIIMKPNEQEEVDALIVKNLKDRIDRLKELKIEQESLLPSQERFNMLVKQLNDVVKDEGAGKLINLTFELEKSLSKLTDPEFLTEENLINFFKDVDKSISDLIVTNEGLFDDENQANIRGYGENLQRLVTTIAQINKVSTDLVTQGVLNQLRDIQIDIIAGDPIQQQKALTNLDELKKKFVETYTTGFKETEKYKEALTIASKLGEEDIKRLNKSIEDGAMATFEGLFNLNSSLLDFKKGITSTIFEVFTLSNELSKLSNVEIFDKLSGEMDLLSQVFNIDFGSIKNLKKTLSGIQDEILKGTLDKEKNYESEVTKFQEFLLTQRIDISKLSYEQKLLLLEQFLAKEVEATEDAEKKKQDSTQKTIDKVLEQIQAAQRALQAIQQAVSDYYNFSFDQLEKRNKRIQDTIVGDSERANELRLEADKAYTAERARLEKQQAKISLRLTLAQTIANVAQAIAQSLGNPVLATIVGIAGAAQVAIIGAQINAIDSYKRGGKIRKGQGGMVVGPSHEDGGVKFQGGGIELEGSEAVINRLSTLRYADILSTINQAGGGRPIVTNNFDDSRIVEAIAKQRSTPIRAYVVESDISNAQTVNKRLELLSQI
jgi:hypothetical protein